tara:strand:+ start:4142 stop:5146 length:1005 start_codon:yes stop_codon:yes gene_type:complete
MKLKKSQLRAMINEELEAISEEELDERSWGQMGKDIMKGDFSGDKRRDHVKQRALYWLKKVAGEMNYSSDTIKDAVATVERDSARRLQRDLEKLGIESLDKLLRGLVYQEYKQVARDHQGWIDGQASKNTRGAKRERARLAAQDSDDPMAMAKYQCDYEGDCDEWDELQARYHRSSGPDYSEKEEDPHERSFSGTRGGDKTTSHKSPYKDWNENLNRGNIITTSYLQQIIMEEISDILESSLTEEDDEEEDDRDLLAMQHDASEEQQAWRDSIEEGDDNWIQKADKDIEKRGTEGKCTPITKPGCTGRAKALAKTFKKMGRERKAKDHPGKRDY